MLVGAVAACGNVAGGKPLDAPVLVADARAMCDPMGAFDTPAVLAGFGTAAQESSPRLTPDELEIYFDREANGESSYDLYRAQRSSRDEAFAKPVALTDVNSTGDDFNPTVRSDGLLLVFESVRAGEMNHIYTSSRGSRAAEFPAPSKLANVNSTGGNEREVQPFITADGQELWFASIRMGGLGGDDIYRATWNGVGFANVEAVTALSTTSTDWLPTLSADKLTIYLVSDRPNGKGRRDIWVAHRVSLSDGFPTPSPLTELNTDSDDLVGWLSPDNCRLYFSSDRAGTSDIYVATRRPK